MKLRHKITIKRVVIFCAGFCAVAVATLYLLLWLFPFPQEKIATVAKEGGDLVLDRDGGLIAWRVDASGAWRIPAKIKDVTPWLAKASIAAEDERFMTHGGVDPIAVSRAIIQNVSSGRRISGASTITMQVIRLLYPRKRTYKSKAIEAFTAMEIEELLSKDEIMELYFNLAPYGGNVIGVASAATRYFGKLPADLTLGEAALLAGLPQRPTRFNPFKNLDAALKRRSYVLKRMLELDYITEEEFKEADNSKIVLSPPEIKTHAPRFADYAVKLSGSGRGVINTTLNSNLQNLVKQTTQEYANKLKRQQVDGVAVVVIDVETSELVAMIGNANAENPQVGGVNAATARRQPGSLLKPFIYSSAFKTGRLTPDGVVYDIPMSWSGYAPQNIDYEFMGAIPAGVALRESRNIPAVMLLEQIGIENFAADLNRLGLNVDGAKHKYGLSLALGTPQMRLIDITNAYAAIARYGRYTPLRIFKSTPEAEGVRVYSPSVAYLTLLALGAKTEAPKAVPVWKTGTSWNNKDAWAISITPKYAVGVWCGNLAGGGNPALLGSTAALPLAIDVITKLQSNEPPHWNAPAGVKYRKACALGGANASSACPQTAEYVFIPGVSSEVSCRIHRRKNNQTQTVWPKVAAAYMASLKTGEPSEKKSELEIVSPQKGVKYVLIKEGDIMSHTLDLKLRCSPDIKKVYWFLDGELLATKAPTEDLSWEMTQGTHRIVATSGDGKSSQVDFWVVLAK